MNLLIKNGNLINPEQGKIEKKDILISDGKVAKIEDSIKEEGDCNVINAEGAYVSPGFIDMHVHLREPGFEYKETIATGSEAAARGGFTSICCMPNTNPVNDNSAVTKYILDKAKTHAKVNVFPVGAVTKGLEGKDLAEIADMKEAGIVAISDDGNPLHNSFIARIAMEYAKSFGLTVIDHCEDPSLAGKGVMHEGYVSTELGLKGIPSISEESMICRDIMLSEYTGCPVHIAHISTTGSLRLIREAKKRGVKISCEVTPHHLTLTDDDVRTYDSNLKMKPPLRTKKDIDALIEGLADGTIDAIATDHAPHASHEKEIEFQDANFGIVGLETAFQLSLRLTEHGKLSLLDIVKKLTTGPAKILGLDKGEIDIGKQADIVVFRDDIHTTVSKDKFYSKSKNTPFDGYKVKGDVLYTICNGKIVYNSESTS